MLSSRYRLILGGAALLAAAALWRVSNRISPQYKRPTSADEYAARLEDPARDAWQQPDRVVAALRFRPEEVVADIGAGSGYFARRIATRVNRVYAVDIDERLLRILAARSPGNIQTVVAAPDDPRLPPASVDTIFLCDALHNLPGRRAYYPKLDRALRPGGRIVVIDRRKSAFPIGLLERARLWESTVTREFADAGYRLSETFDFLPRQYFMVFRRTTDQ
jgi:ubiquinone/menaquinone biosynthesis C-methylase UbiE